MLPSGLCFCVIRLGCRPRVYQDRGPSVTGTGLYDAQQDWFASLFQGTPQAATVHPSIAQDHLFFRPSKFCGYLGIRSILRWNGSSLIITPFQWHGDPCHFSFYLRNEIHFTVEWEQPYYIATSNGMGPRPQNPYSLNYEEMLPKYSKCYIAQVLTHHHIHECLP